MNYPFPTPPAAGQVRSWRFPTYDQTTLPSGLRSIACPLPGRRLASLLVVVPTGAAAEPWEGVAALMARCLSEGTVDRDERALTATIERLGASLDAEASWDAIQVRLDLPVSRLREGLALLAEVVRGPAFADAAVERVRRERLDEIRQELADPAGRAASAFDAAAFAPRTPYSRPLAGDVAAVTALERSHLVDHHAATVKPDGCVVIAAGDVGPAEAHRTVHDVFGDWAGTPVGAVTDPIRPGTAGIVLVDRPGAVQSAVAMGHVGPARHTPDYAAIRLADTCLSGGFMSRIYYLLREEKGYTYGVQGGFDLRRDGGVYRITAAIRTEATADAVALASEQIRAVHDRGVDEAEVSYARDLQVGRFPLQFATARQVAEGIAELLVLGLPDQAHDATREALAAATVEDVNAAAKTHLDPDGLVVVVVGDGQTVGPALDELGEVTRVAVPG